VVRIFIGLLIGFMIGVGGTIHYLSSGKGNVQLMTSPQVHQLEEQIKQGNAQVDQLTKKLEAAAEAMERTAAKFTALEHRIEALRPSSAAEAPPSSATPDSSATKPEEPTSGSTPQPAESPSPS
jgi:outer membrane murein-binding lipoprotein Lpp